MPDAWVAKIRSDIEPKTTVLILHLEHCKLDEVIAFLVDRACPRLRTLAGLQSVLVFAGRDEQRAALYVHWKSASAAADFSCSSVRSYIERGVAAFDAVGQFRSYNVVYVKDSLTGDVTSISRSYRGVVAINEVAIKTPENQKSLTSIMIRTDAITRCLPFHHSTNIHASMDGSTNLNILQFRLGIVRIVLWLVLRLGRTTEALRYGSPDVRFYSVALCEAFDVESA